MRAYERLLQYARVYTTSDPESGTHPSAAREFDLAHMLVEEMKNLGIEDARVGEAVAQPQINRSAYFSSSPTWTPPRMPAAKTSTPSSTRTMTAMM